MATGPPPAPEMVGLQVPTASLTTRAGNVEAAGSLRVHNIPNPARFATNNSDALSQSVWSRKMLLSFDGGGIRGYSSLIILHKLLEFIAILERGGTPNVPQGNHRKFEPPCSSSTDYPWFRRNSTTNLETTRSSAVHVELSHSSGHPAEQNLDAVAGAPRADEMTTPVPSNAEQSGETPDLSFHESPDQPEGSSNPSTLPGDSSSGRNFGISEGTGKTIDNSVAFDASKFLPHHYFDYMAGTSTGGLSALMLSRMKMNIADAMEQYDVVGDGVFAHPRIGFGLTRPKFKTANMKIALHDVLRKGLKEEGERTEMKTSDIRLKNENIFACQTAVVAYKHHGSTSKPHIFRSYDHPRLVTPNKDEIRLNDEPASLARIWKVARATSAAAGYFRQQDIENCTYEDGGMGTNNPSFYIHKDIGQINGGRTPDLIVSIGTGTKDEIRKSTAKQRARKSQGRNPLKYSKGLYHSLRQLSEITTDSEKDHEHLESAINNIKTKLQRLNIPSEYPRYYRFNVPGLGVEVALDEWHPSRDPGQPNQTLSHIREMTNDYLNEVDVQKQLLECAVELVSSRRERAMTERWEAFATHTVYSCHHTSGCNPVGLASREELRKHAFEHHQVVTRTISPAQRYCTLNECASAPTRIQHVTDINAALLEHLRDCHPSNDLSHPPLGSGPKSETGSPDDTDVEVSETFDVSAYLKQSHGLGDSQPAPEMFDHCIKHTRECGMLDTPNSEASKRLDALIKHLQEVHGLGVLKLKTPEELDDELVDHLKEAHGFSEPELKTPDEMEAWLDERRQLRQQARPRPPSRESPKDMEEPGWLRRSLRRSGRSEAEAVPQYDHRAVY